MNFRAFLAIFLAFMPGTILGQEDAQPSSLVFMNELDAPVEVFWVSPTGLVFVDRLQPESEFEHDTWIGHSFEVRRLPEANETLGALVGSWDIQWAEERIAIRPENQPGSAVAMIVNRRAEPVNLFFREELQDGTFMLRPLGAVQPGEEAFQQSWIGHKFVAQDLEGNTLHTFTANEAETPMIISADS